MNGALAGKKICLTGASGFLGSHLLPLLEESGAEITCIVRKTTDRTKLRGRIVTADLQTGEGLEEALAGQDMLMHLAALLFGSSWQEYLAQNSAAAMRIAEACGDLEKIVLISSLAASGPSSGAPGKNEKDLPAPVSAYGWSKLLCENILQKRLGERVTILRPPIIYGSGDRGLLPVFRGLARGVAVAPGKSFPVSVIHAQDAAQAALACLKTGACGVYHASDGQPLELAEFYRAAAKALGKKNPIIFRAPISVMGAAAYMSAFMGRLGGSRSSRPPAWNPDKFREAKAGGWICDDSRIRNELDFRPQMPLQAGMAETVNGYRKQGLL